MAKTPAASAPERTLVDYIRRGTIDEETGELTVDVDDAFGVVRLWRERPDGTAVPTRFFWVICEGERANRPGERLRNGDRTRVFERLAPLERQLGRLLREEYGASLGRHFRLDLRVPADLLDGYTG